MPTRVVVKGLCRPEHPRVRLQEYEQNPCSHLQQNKLDDEAAQNNHDERESHQPVEEPLIIFLDEKRAGLPEHLEREI